MSVKKTFVDEGNKDWTLERFDVKGDGRVYIRVQRKGHQEAHFDLDTAGELGAELVRITGASDAKVDTSKGAAE